MPLRSCLVVVCCVLTGCYGPTRLDDEERDWASLGSALESFYNVGIVGEDANAVRAFLYARNDADAALVAAQTRRIIANVRFLRALDSLDVDVPHGVNPFAEFHIFLADDFMAWSGLEIRGDRAVASLKDFDPNVVKAIPSLVRVRGKWKVDVTPNPAPASNRDLARAIDQYAAALERTTESMKVGQLSTLEDVRQALQQAPRFAHSDFTPDLILAL